MREDSDHAGWANPGGSNDRWDSFPVLVTAAVLFTMALFVVGTGLAQFGADVGGERAEALASATGAATAPTATTPTDIGSAAVEVAGPLVPASTEHLTIVRISTNSCGARQTGTGVVIADGVIVTAAHVVGDAGIVRVDAFGVTVSGEVLGVSADGRDLALVAVDAPLLEPVVAGRTLRIGEPLTLVGHAGGGVATTAVGPTVEVVPGVAAAVIGEVIGVDAAIEIGMSGGPALDRDGRLVGIIVGTEAVSDTALVVATDDLGALTPGRMLPGTCPTSA